MDLKFMIWNPHSLRCKYSEFTSFLKDHSVDVVFLSETWLSSQDSFSIENFSIYRADRPRGGTAILIRSSIPHSTFSKINLDFAESASVHLLLTNCTLTLTSIYISPAASRQQAKYFFEKILNRPGEHLVAGDWNCKHNSWNNSNYNLKGNDLFNLSNSFNFSFLVPDHPTHLPYRGDLSTIDFALKRSNLIFSQLNTVNDLSSDHLPVLFSLRTNLDPNDDLTSFNYSKANWPKLVNCVDAKILSHSLDSGEFSSIEDIDKSIDTCTNILIESMNESIPRRKNSFLRYKFSDKIHNLIKHRNYYRRLFQNTRDVAYKSCVNQLNRMIRREIQLDKRSLFNDKLKSLNHLDDSLFQFTKSRKKKRHILPPLESNNSKAYSDKDKANMLANCFLEAHEASSNAVSKYDDEVKASIESLNSTPLESFDKISFDDVVAVLLRLKSKKAPGPDIIPNCVLKSLHKCKRFVVSLVAIFNACLSLSYFPVEWKKAKILPIPKTLPASNNPSDFRPISLLSTMSKVFERLILDRMNIHESANKIIINEQFGFKNQHSTTQQVLRITESVSLGFNKNKSTGMVLLDLRKAYDSVWTDGLVYKLLKFNYPVSLVKLIYSFLKSRQAFVCVNSSNSDYFVIPAGVPQGAIIAPHLFNVFINDIPIPRKGNLALFADDTAYFIKGTWKNLKFIKKHLLLALKLFQEYFSDWKIFLNHNKTEFIMFSKSYKMLNNCSSDIIQYNGIDFNWMPSVKYLGVYLDSKLTFKVHIDQVLRKAKGVAFSSMYCLLKRDSYVDTQSKLIIYKTIVRPAISYACPIFLNCANVHLRKLQIFQNQILRLIFNIKWDDFISTERIHIDSNMPYIIDFFMNITRRFYLRCENSENDLINSLGRYKYSELDFTVKHRLAKPLLI